MARHKSGKFSIAKAVTIGTEFMLLNVSNQVVNSIPNVPPIVKTFLGISTSFENYEILSKATDNLPPMMRKIAKPLIEVQSLLLVVQQVPNLIAALGSGISAGQSTVP